jgi:hypothetical protein
VQGSGFKPKHCKKKKSNNFDYDISRKLRPHMTSKFLAAQQQVYGNRENFLQWVDGQGLFF